MLYVSYSSWPSDLRGHQSSKVCEVGMLVSCGFCNKLTSIGWLKTKEFYSLIVLEARGLKSVSLIQNWDVCLGIPEENLFLPLLASLACGHINLVSTSMVTCLKKQWHHFADKGAHSQSYGFSSSHVWMWELNHKEGWAQKNWCFWTVVLEKTLESPLDSKISPVNPKGNPPWIFIGRTDAEAEAPLLCPPNAKSWFIWKVLDAGKIEGKRSGWQRMRWLDSITNWMDRNLSKLHEIVEDRGA